MSSSSAQGGDLPVESWRRHGKPGPKLLGDEQGKEGQVGEGFPEASEWSFKGQWGFGRHISRAKGRQAEHPACPRAWGLGPGLTAALWWIMPVWLLQPRMYRG